MMDPREAHRIARELSSAQFSRDASAQGAGKLLKKLRVLADGEFSKLRDAVPQMVCQPGCNACCHEPTPVSMPEIIDLAVRVAAWTPGDREELRRRGETYRQQAKLDARPRACPFLVNGLCSVYEHRPLNCRGKHSTDLVACQQIAEGKHVVRPGAMAYTQSCDAMTDGVAVFMPGRSYSDQFELGLYAERIALGAEPGDHLTSSLVSPTNPIEGEPLGFFFGTPPAAQEFQALEDACELDQAMRQLSFGSETENRLMRFWTPLAYSSQDEVAEWSHRADLAMSVLEDTKVDAPAAFNLLSLHSTYPMSYSGEPIKELFGRYGRWILEKVIRPLFPDLTAPIEEPRKPGKIRFGIASEDVQNKNGARWSAAWLEALGPEIETFVFHLGNLEDRVTERFMRAADHFYYLPVGVAEAARLIRSLDLDVLLFPALGQNGRAVQFASMRLARKQVTGWGFPTTSGLPNIDEYWVGEDMLPSAGDVEFHEKVVRLPRTGVVVEHSWVPPGAEDLPPLPKDYLLMGQNLVKLIPRYDTLLKAITEQTGKPLVMVEHPKQGVTRVIRNRLAAQGIPVLWLPFLSYRQFDRLMAGALVSVDTQVWSAGYTAMQGLQLGTPVVTLPGDTMRSCLSVGFLKKAGLGDCVCDSEEEYLRKVCNPDFLLEQRARIDQRALHENHDIKSFLNTLILASVGA